MEAAKPYKVQKRILKLKIDDKNAEIVLEQ